MKYKIKWEKHLLKVQNLSDNNNNISKVFTSNHRIVLKTEKDKFLGFIKVGV